MARIRRFDPRLPEFAMRGRVAPQSYRSGFAVIFFDFRSTRDVECPFLPLVGAGALRLRSQQRAAKAVLSGSAAVAVTYAQL